MKIDAERFPQTALRTGRPWCITRSMIDPLLVLGAYLFLLWLMDEPFGEDDVALLTATLLLIYPGKVPFNRYSWASVEGALVTFVLLCFVVLALRIVRANLAAGGADLLAVDAALVWVAVAPLLLLAIHAVSPMLAPHLQRLYRPTKVVVVGINDAALRLAHAIENGEAEGHRLVACFDDRQAQRVRGTTKLCVDGRFSSVGEYVRRNGVDIVYVSLPLSSHPRVLAILGELRDTTASICFIPDVFAADLIQGRLETVAGLPVVSICDTPFRGSAGIVKRSVDVLLTLAVLPVVLPLMGVIALLIRLTSCGPAIFKQRRYGLDGKEILVWKFRTMVAVEDGDKNYRQVTRDDARVTPLGRFLRRTSLDELPQLINVLQGSMSLVGPRPHALAVNEQFRRLIPGYMVRHKVRPGITGWAQVNGFRGGDDLESMRKRTEFDIAYLRTWSIGLDLLIILRTVRILLLGDSKAF
jgi:putative colanic acid biosysnthesis UDP-glucose lipid carrier transferase